MTDGTVRPDESSLADLERLLGHLMDELASWRRRCLQAESELQELKKGGKVPSGPALSQASDRIIALETDNRALRERVEGARERLRTLSARLAFLESEEGAA